MAYINTVFPSQINSAFKPAFTDAGDFWNKVILSGSGGFTFSSSTNANNFCGVNFVYRPGDRINGLDIFAVVEPIDGPGSVLGSAGPCAFLGDFPVMGLMRFDSADAQGLLNQGNFAEVIIHEMGHVIGMGTMWRDLVVNPCPNSGTCFTDPKYIGNNGREGFRNLGGTGEIPVANTGGGGTRNGHWREDFFLNELMTGFLNSGTRNPLSIMSVKSLRDLGYQTDTSASESYNIPSEFQRPLDTDDMEMVGDILFFQPVDIEEAEAAQRITVGTTTTKVGGLFAVMFIGFMVLGMLMYSFQRKQQKQVMALLASQARNDASPYLPMRKK